MTRTLYDSVTAKDIPRNAAMVGGYVSGTYRWSDADWALFPDAVQVRIATQANVNDGNCLDVEPGDATPEQSVDWVLMRRRAGLDPSVYCNQLNGWPAVKDAFRRRGIAEPHYWVARYDGSPLIPGGAVAKQYANPALHKQGHFDLSVVSDYWPGVDMQLTPEEIDAFAENVATKTLWRDDDPDPNVTEPVWSAIHYLRQDVTYVRTIVDQLRIGGIDYAALAKAVNDDAARRLAQ